jgi:hypothetical protein
MTSSIKRLIGSIVATLFLSACASVFSSANSSQIFYKDGKIAYVASCKSANWGPCLERAGEICQGAGYTILEKNNRWMSDGDAKEMVFACNGTPASAEDKSSSIERKL